MIRNSYEPPGHSLRLEIFGHYIMDQREVTYNNFLGYASKFKSNKARTALIKNKARQMSVSIYDRSLYHFNIPSTIRPQLFDQYLSGIIGKQ